jgi:hypothetical protein
MEYIQTLISMYAKRMTSDGEAVILLNITSTGRIIALGNYIRKLGIIALGNYMESSHQTKGKPAIWLLVEKSC